MLESTSKSIRDGYLTNVGKKATVLKGNDLG